MKINVKEVKNEVFEPIKLELTFENKRELEVLKAWLTLEAEDVNKSNYLCNTEVTNKDDDDVICKIYSSVKDVLDDL